MLNSILTSANGPLGVTNLTGAFSPTTTLTYVPLGTSNGTATGELAVKVVVVGSGGSSGGSVVIPRGAANIVTGQVNSATTAGTFTGARATRRSIAVTNMDATITVYVGAPGATSTTTGQRLKAGESQSFDTTAAMDVIAESGTPRICWSETYD